MLVEKSIKELSKIPWWFIDLFENWNHMQKKGPFSKAYQDCEFWKFLTTKISTKLGSKKYVIFVNIEKNRYNWILKIRQAVAIFFYGWKFRRTLKYFYKGCPKRVSNSNFGFQVGINAYFFPFPCLFFLLVYISPLLSFSKRISDKTNFGSRKSMSK